MKKRFLYLFLLFSLLVLPVRAADEPAEEFTRTVSVLLNGNPRRDLADNNGYSVVQLIDGSEITVQSTREIGSLYMEFVSEPGLWTLTTDSGEIECGRNGFIHEYIGDLSTHSLTMRFSGPSVLSDVHIFSTGERPDWVQDWDPPLEKADVLLLPAHSDDDQLFFGGVIPWCQDRGASVQVAYLISHLDDVERRHEVLDGIWHCGSTNYPIMGEYTDLGRCIEPPYATYEKLGVTRDDFVDRYAALYRRFRPQIVITHDEKGEYIHGAHILAYQVSTEAVAAAADPSRDVDSLEKYGVWQVPKVYTHLWKEGQVLIDLDEPLESYGGRTAFEVSKEAFWLHKTQYMGFGWWSLPYDRADQIREWNPREYGLWASTVGPDSNADTFFDNIILYSEQDRLAREAEEAELARLAEEQRAAEEAERKAEEEARLAREEQLRREAEEKAAEEERLRAAAEQERSRERLRLGCMIGAAVLVVLAAVILLRRMNINGSAKSSAHSAEPPHRRGY